MNTAALPSDTSTCPAAAAAAAAADVYTPTLDEVCGREAAGVGGAPFMMLFIVNVSSCTDDSRCWVKGKAG